MQRSVYSWLHRIIARFQSSAVVCVSSALCRELGFNRLQKCRVVFNVVTPHTSDERQKPPVIDHHPSVVIVGRLVRVKRIDLAIGALGKLTALSDRSAGSVELIVVGDGPERDSLKDLCRTMELVDRVKFVGFRDDARVFIAEADALMITSDSEGIPSVLLEAIAAETPVLSRALPGVIEVLDQFPDYPAAVVESADPKVLADALRELLNSANLPRNPGHWSTALTASFSPQAAAACHLRLYRDLLKS